MSSAPRRSAERRLRAALVRVRIANPFFGTLALYARFLPTKELPTAATDGRDVFFNAAFVESLDPAELEAVLMHEVLHAALGHVHRRAGREATQWNQAADIVVNGLVAAAGLRLPAGALRDPALETYSVEEVFAILARDPEPRPAVPADLLDARPADAGAHDGTDDSHGPSDPAGAAPKPAAAGGHPAHQQATDDRRYWAAAVDRATAVARSQRAGSLPAGIERAFDLDDRPRLDWRALLWRFLTRTPTDFAAFDRRHLHRGLYLETLESTSLVVSVAIDTSGSIAADDLTTFRGEIDALLCAYPAITAHLVYADAEAHGPYPLAPGGELPPPVGGGGTDFRPFFDLLAEQSLDGENAVAVYLTDGYGTFPDEPPPLPVLWVVTPGGLDDDRFPFGSVARLV